MSKDIWYRALVVVGMVVGVAGGLIAFSAAQGPNVPWTIIGIVLLVAGIVIVAYGRFSITHLSAVLTLALVLAVGVASVASAIPLRHPPVRTVNSTEYRSFDNNDTAKTRVGHARLFTTDLRVGYKFNWRTHKVYILGWKVLPSESSLGSTEGWTMDGSRLVAKSCFDVAGYRTGRSGCGVEVEAHWHNSCVLKLCGSTKTRYLRTFVYFDGNVQRKNTDTP